MYIRKQIIENQKKFRKEIIDSLKLEFKEAKKELADIKTEDKIIAELVANHGKATDIGGYYLPDDVKASKAMRPSATLNAIIG